MEEKRPLISVIIPVYGVEKYLNRCVESVVRQTYSNLEIILVDDGSPDKCPQMCDEWAHKDPRIRTVHRENGGLSCARNTGLSIASGDFIGFIDSDDWIALDMYAHLYGLIEQYHADLSQCNYMHAYSKKDLPKSKSWEEKNIEHRDNILEYYMTTTTTTGSYSVCRCLIKSVIAKKYRFREGKINEDIDYKYKVFSDCNKIAISDKICYFYFQSGDSTSLGKLKIKDFDLVDAAEELRRLTDKETYGHIRFYGQVKVARTAFSLLCKIAYYGLSDDIENPHKLIKDLTREHRLNVGLLLKAPIPVSRKVLSILLAVNINLVRWPLKILKILR